MLVSHEHNFIFVHIAKTAGSSIQDALEPFADRMPGDRWSRFKSKAGIVTNPESTYWPKHADYRFVRKRLGSEAYDRMFTFAFVRNPWDLLVSSYHYIQRNQEHHRNAKIGRLESFDDYIDYEIRRNKAFQTPGIYDDNDQPMVNFIGHFENLAEDFSTVCGKIGISAELPHVNASLHASYQDLYTTALRDKVASFWRRDIELLEYSFGD